MKAKRGKKTEVMSSRGRIILYSIAALLALAGLADATYLTVQAFTGETAICGGSSGCFAVLGSAYAKIGVIPTAAFGVLGYFGVFSFATFAAFGSNRAAKFFGWNVWVMFVGTLWLLYVQAFVLHAFCRFCLFSAATTFLLTGLIVARNPSD
jgi:uncharacterized membrane protein